MADTWRKVASRKTPTHYRLALGQGWFRVQADGGLLDFRAPLVGRVPTARDRQGADHVYGAVAPDRLVELSFHAGRLVGRSDLALARNGRSFTERHVDAAGHRVVIVFARLGTAPESAAPAG